MTSKDNIHVQEGIKIGALHGDFIGTFGFTGRKAIFRHMEYEKTRAVMKHPPFQRNRCSTTNVFLSA